MQTLAPGPASCSIPMAKGRHREQCRCMFCHRLDERSYMRHTCVRSLLCAYHGAELSTHVLTRSRSATSPLPALCRHIALHQSTMQINNKLVLGGVVLTASALASVYAFGYIRQHPRCKAVVRGNTQSASRDEVRDRISQEYLAGIISSKHHDALKAVVSKVSCIDAAR